MRWGSPHYDPELANSDLTSVGYTASQDDTQFDESDVTDSDASQDSPSHEEHIEGSGKTITWDTTLTKEREYHPNQPASQSLRRSKRVSRKMNYFTNTLQLEDFRRPTQSHIQLAAAAEKVGWAVERLTNCSTDYIKEFTEAQRDYELHAADMAKTYNEAPGHKKTEIDRINNMPFEEAMMMGLPDITPTHLANVAEAVDNNTDYGTKLKEEIKIHDVDEIDLSKFPGDLFQPEPTTWRQISKLPPHLAKCWIKAAKDEMRTQVRMGTFSIEPRPAGAEMVGVTLKMRAKQKADGFLDKLKARLCLRGDQQEERSDLDTWVAIGNCRGTRHFLASAADKKCRVHQLDFQGAFLQSYTRDLTYTRLPAEWAKWMPEYAEYFGVDLRVVKALYGDVTANKCWDEELSDFLINTLEFVRCLAEPSIFIKRLQGHELVLINAVDDQLYYSTSDKMREWFEKCVNAQYKADFMGQAHWYLQSRITQHANFDITFDQSRYIAVICNRFLPNLGVMNVTDAERQKFSAPLPHDFVASKEDRSKNFLEVQELQEEFGFEYPSVVGMLIYLMNTAFALHFPISKLAKFNSLPGKKHFKAIKHLLMYLRCHHTKFGLRYYSDETQSPIYKRLQDYTTADLSCPLKLFTDSSWQDCPDDGRSTGCYLLYFRGGLVNAGSFVPTPIALSSAEAEYNALAHSFQAVVNSRQLIHELYGNNADTPLSIPVFCDSESAIAIGSNLKDTKRTRHIQRRVHYVRDNIDSRNHTVHKIDGELNPSDVGTKNLSADVLDSHVEVMHVTVDP